MSAGLDRPVILMGRGGSGTRMLAEIAQGVGVFLGSAQNVSADSLEWVDTLYELALAATGGRLTPASEQDGGWRARLRLRAIEILAAAGKNPDDAWGWKLPETMLVLDHVLRAFPRAKVVHLVRHPLTSSLRRTHMTSRVDNPVGQAVLPAAYLACGLDPARIGEDEPFVHNAITWTYQVGRALELLQVAGADVLQLRYESLCASPRSAQQRLADFVGLPVPIDAEICRVDEARTNPVDPTDERADRVWEVCGETAARVGYDRQP